MDRKQTRNRDISIDAKILKLKTINKGNVSNLTCRGIKSLMGDPINLIQKILDKVNSHLLYYIEIQLTRFFGKLSPSVTVPRV